METAKYKIKWDEVEWNFLYIQEKQIPTDAHVSRD